MIESDNAAVSSNKELENRIHALEKENRILRQRLDEAGIYLLGNDPNGNDVVAIYPMLENNLCQLLVFDFDNHAKRGRNRRLMQMPATAGKRK